MKHDKPLLNWNIPVAALHRRADRCRNEFRGFLVRQGQRFAMCLWPCSVKARPIPTAHTDKNRNPGKIAASVACGVNN